MQYDLEGLPAEYRRNNTYEQIRIKFDTEAPNGLLWYIGSYDRSTHLSIKVRLPLEYVLCRNFADWAGAAVRVIVC